MLEAIYLVLAFAIPFALSFVIAFIVAEEINDYKKKKRFLERNPEIYKIGRRIYEKQFSSNKKG